GSGGRCPTSTAEGPDACALGSFRWASSFCLNNPSRSNMGVPPLGCGLKNGYTRASRMPWKKSEDITVLIQWTWPRGAQFGRDAGKKTVTCQRREATQFFQRLVLMQLTL